MTTEKLLETVKAIAEIAAEIRSVTSRMIQRELIQEITIPDSILKPKCDACKGSFEPSALISHYHCGLGTRNYCQSCYTPDTFSGNAS